MPFSKGGGGIDQLTGDVLAGPGTGSQAATLDSVTTAETVGDATHYPIITTDAKGRVITATAQLAPSAGVSISRTVGRWHPMVLSSGSFTMNTGVLTALPIVIFSTHTFVGIGVNIVTGGTASSVRLGIYADNGGTPVGGSLVLDAGTVATTAAGAAAITISQSLSPGVYWLVAVQVAATANAICTGIITTEFSPLGYSSPGVPDNSSTGFISSASTYTGALPATFPAANPFQVAFVSIMA